MKRWLGIVAMAAAISGLTLAARAAAPGSGVERAASAPAGLHPPAPGGESPAVLLEKGIYLEETVGDIDGAIKVYKQVVDEAKANRMHAAQAQLRLVRCYQRKGDEESTVREFQKLGRSFSMEELSALGTRDKIDYPFVDDPAVKGGWKSVDFVSQVSDFDPNAKSWKGDLYLKDLLFLDGGKTEKPWWTWTKGLLIHHGDRTAAKYQIKQIGGADYLFLEWKSGDVVFLGRKPLLYVLARADSSAPQAAGSPGRLPEGVMAFIVGDHLKAWAAAQAKGLPVNAHIYAVDEGLVGYFGGFMTYRNESNQPVAGPVHVTNFGPQRPDYVLVDERGEPQQYELRENPDLRLGKWGLWWTPDKPVAPGAMRLLGYISKETMKLPVANGDAFLSMSNQFGPPVLETFYLVVPTGMKVTEAGTKPRATVIASFAAMDVYAWMEQVPANTTHKVEVVLKAPPGGFAAGLDARAFAEAFLAAALGGRDTEAISMTDPASAVGRQVAEFRKVVPAEGKTVHLQTVLADDQDAMALTSAVKDNLDRVGRLLFSLNRSGGLWVVSDVGFKVADGADAVLTAFAQQHPGARTVSGAGPQRQTTEADKRQAESLAAGGWELWNHRKLAEAEAKFQAAVAKDPTSANAWNGLGWAQQNQGKPLNAKASFQKALQINPKVPGALNGLGWIAKGEGKTDEAIAYWKRAVEADPAATAALAGLASTYMELKQYDRAVQCYETLAKAEPNNPEIKAGLEAARKEAAKQPTSAPGSIER